MPKLGAARKFLGFIKGKDALVIGPGLGLKFAKKIVKILHKIDMPMVLDADILNALSETNNLAELKSNVIITPHVGEAARLLKCSNEYVKKNIIECAEKLVDMTGAVVVLKSHNTVVLTKNQNIFINTTGNAGMATGGSGDVLAGLISSLLARINAFDAACCGVFLHSLAGDFAMMDKGEESMTAMDIAENISKAYKMLATLDKSFA